MMTVYILKNGHAVSISNEWERAYGSYTLRKYTEFYIKQENGKHRNVQNYTHEERAKFHEEYFKNWKQNIEKVIKKSTKRK